MLDLFAIYRILSHHSTIEKLMDNKLDLDSANIYLRNLKGFTNLKRTEQKKIVYTAQIRQHGALPALFSILITFTIILSVTMVLRTIYGKGLCFWKRTLLGLFCCVVGIFLWRSLNIVLFDHRLSKSFKRGVGGGQGSRVSKGL
jgi:hypothetical protein